MIKIITKASLTNELVIRELGTMEIGPHPDEVDITTYGFSDEEIFTSSQLEQAITNGLVELNYKGVIIGTSLVSAYFREFGGSGLTDTLDLNYGFDMGEYTGGRLSVSLVNNNDSEIEIKNVKGLTRLKSGATATVVKNNGSWVFSGSGSGFGLDLSTETKESQINATKNNLIIVDATENPITVLPPENPETDDEFAVSDSRSNSRKNNITIDFLARNTRLNSISENAVLNSDKSLWRFKYINDTIGWIII